MAENNIRAAIDRGELDNLPGHGKPLRLDDDSAIPPELRAGYRMLKNAGYLPPEMVALREIKEIEELLLRVGSDREKTRLIVKLGLLKSKRSGNSAL